MVVSNSNTQQNKIWIANVYQISPYCICGVMHLPLYLLQ